VLFVEIQQLVSKGRELEVVILFADSFRRAPAFRTRRAGSHGIHIKLVKHAILAGVGALIDVTLFLQAAEKFLRAP
jgi:hypothetical protein